jgi:hypothetical protein
MHYIGIDNGVTNNGIGVVSSAGEGYLFKLPVKKNFSYTKKEKKITRIDYPKLVETFNKIKDLFPGEKIEAVLERPMVNSTRFAASMSAMRAVEATQIALEACDIPYSFIDSKAWQRVLLSAEAKGEELKAESLKVGKELFPKLPFKKDADGILIAEYSRRMANRVL